MPRPKKSAHLRHNIAELRRRVNSSNVARQFHFELAQAEHGRVVMRMRVAALHRQIHGVVHGGIMAALIDTAGGLATYMALPPGRRAATIELKINYLEGVERGTILADARVVRIGRHIAVVHCDAHDQRGRLVATALMTFFVGPFGNSAKPLSRAKPRR
jgi:uncharacterized protein (TIGR00369 family)